jgi:hypothetical protein
LPEPVEGLSFFASLEGEGQAFDKLRLSGLGETGLLIT